MSAEKASLAATEAPRLKPNQVFCKGKIEAVEDNKGDTVYTTVVCPAADAYSSPAVVQIWSKRRIGREGDEVSLLCQIGGYRNKFTTRDNKEVVGVRMHLVAVE